MATSKARKGEIPRSLSIWFKQPFAMTNSRRVLMDSNALVIDFLESVIEKGQLRNISTKQPSLEPSILNVTHKAAGKVVLIPHDVPLTSIDDITARNPLIIDQIDDCKCQN